MPLLHGSGIHDRILTTFKHNKHQWSSGRIVPCHGTDPGSIPGWCKILLSCEDNCAGLWHGSAIIFQSFLMEVSVHLSLITFWLYCYTHYPHDSCSHLFLGLSPFSFFWGTMEEAQAKANVSWISTYVTIANP